MARRVWTSRIGQRIYWWTSRVRDDSKNWTTWPVLLIRNGDFAHVEGLVGKYAGKRFSVVQSELTDYPPIHSNAAPYATKRSLRPLSKRAHSDDRRVKLAVGAAPYLAEWEAQAYARRSGAVVLTSNRTANDPKKSRRYLWRLVRAGEWGVWDSVRRMFVGMTFATKRGAKLAADTRNNGETLMKAKHPQRDPASYRSEDGEVRQNKRHAVRRMRQDGFKVRPGGSKRRETGWDNDVTLVNYNVLADGFVVGHMLGNSSKEALADAKRAHRRAGGASSTNIQVRPGAKKPIGSRYTSTGWRRDPEKRVLARKRPQRDPETRRAIRRLEVELHETRDIKRVVRILEKLVALYSELGDARGVMRCKADLRRAEAISDRHDLRTRRRGHRVSTSRRHHSRRGRTIPHNGDIIDISKNVLWHKDDLALVELPNGVCLLIQETMAGPVVRKPFKDSQTAVAYLLNKYGPLFFKSNDPNGRSR